MKNFTSIHDVNDLNGLLIKAQKIKSEKPNLTHLGKGKTLGLLFFNPSLRTRMSTQIAAYNLGLNVMVMDLNKDSWQLEFGDGAVMNGSTSEHIKEAAGVLSSYCHIVGLRSFPSLMDKQKDTSEAILNSFLKHLTVPLISLESSTRHPLQSFADIITLNELHQKAYKPKVAITWAPHIKALPQAVTNSFAEWALAYGANVCIAQPKGYEMDEAFTKGASITYVQEDALENADFVYVKNWSSFSDYGKMPKVNEDWLLHKDKLKLAPQAKIMHCLPVRRNVELPDEILDSEFSIVQQQAANRIISAQTVLAEILENSL
jgi:N-succinyl-L-ornithine transcarbamylase